MSKENVIRSKIPIPVHPLPPLSEHTLRRNRIIKNENHPRRPLETLYQEAVDSESSSLNHRKIKKGLRRSNSAEIIIDAQHVTIRNNNEDLDWNYDVFKDSPPHDDNNKRKINNKDALEAPKESLLGESSKVSTPALKTLSNQEPSGIRNIKKSLKRAHSRELIGISPEVSDNKGEEKHKRRLVFATTNDCLAGKSNDSCTHTGPNPYASSYDQDYGEDLFNYLLKKETIPKQPRITSSKRSLTLNWIVKVNGPTGNPAAVQTAAWYLDTLLSVGEVDKLKVVAAACYWIALKIHGTRRSAKKMVTTGAHAYSAKLLMAAEEAVLRKLKFPIQPIVAQDFISYLSWMCDSSNYEEIESAATLLYMAGLVVNKSLVVNYPSVLATAAMCNALNLLRKKDLLVKLHKHFIYKEAVKKGSNFVRICLQQRDALSKMASPRFEYRALLQNAKDPTLTEKILTSIKNIKKNTKSA